MTADEALRLFAEVDELPRDALQWALDHWDEASPRFISKLRAHAANPTELQVDLHTLFCIVHLCGEKRDLRAYVPLCDLIATDDAIRDWLGVGVTASVTGILVNVYDGDVDPLKRAIEAPDADEFARAAAIDALAWLVRAKGATTDDEMGDYLVHLADVMRPRAQSTVWSAWACAVGQLGYIQLRGLVTRMFAKGWVNTFETSREDFFHDLRLARGRPDGLAAFEAAGVRPFGSAIEALERLEDLESDEEGELENPDEAEGDLDYSEEDDPYLEVDDLSDSREAEQPYINPLREVGRNDPCPCGSGKKYKKCCLAA